MRNLIQFEVLCTVRRRSTCLDVEFDCALNCQRHLKHLKYFKNLYSRQQAEATAEADEERESEIAKELKTHKTKNKYK